MALGRPVVQAYLTSSLVRVCRLAGMLRRPSGAAAEFEVPVSAGEGPRWQPMLDTLRSAIAGQSGFRLQVVLGDEWLRYALLPAFDSGLRAAEIHALASSVLQRTYGDSMQGWEIRISAAGERALLAVAMDGRLLRALEEFASRAEARLDAVAPAFVQFLGRVGRRARRPCWVLALEPAAAVIALFADNDLRALRVRRSPLRDPAELGELLERERLRVGTEVRDVIAGGEGSDALALPAGWTPCGERVVRPLLDCESAPRFALQAGN